MPLPQTTIYLYFVGIRTTSGVFHRQIRLTSRGVWCYAEKQGPDESGVQLAGTRKKTQRKLRKSDDSSLPFCFQT